MGASMMPCARHKSLKTLGPDEILLCLNTRFASTLPVLCVFRMWACAGSCLRSQHGLSCLLLLQLVKALAASHGETSVTEQRWQTMHCLEHLRQERLRVSS